MRRLAALGLALTLAGCASWSLPATRLLDRGDQLLAAGEYAGALTAYDELLESYPNHSEASRVRLTRETILALLDLRAEIGRLRTELKRVRELLETRQADLERITAEAEKLRADLEQLKQIEILLERRRR